MKDNEPTFITADWKDTEDLTQQFVDLLEKIGYIVYEDPITEGSDTIGYIVSKVPYSEKELRKVSEDRWDWDPVD